jgi:hypothetical protein
LCERIGYYGAFELEFVVTQGRMLLIDFNGRFYNQLAFGMDLPKLVYADPVEHPGPHPQRRRKITDRKLAVFGIADAETAWLD